MPRDKGFHFGWCKYRDIKLHDSISCNTYRNTETCTSKAVFLPNVFLKGCSTFCQTIYSCLSWNLNSALVRKQASSTSFYTAHVSTISTPNPQASLPHLPTYILVPKPSAQQCPRPGRPQSCVPSPAELPGNHGVVPHDFYGLHYCNVNRGRFHGEGFHSQCQSLFHYLKL